jgi:hypothetical protein
MQNYKNIFSLLVSFSVHLTPKGVCIVTQSKMFVFGNFNAFLNIKSSIEKAGRRNTVYCEIKIQMFLIPIFFLNCLLVKLSSAPKGLEEQTPTM